MTAPTQQQDSATEGKAADQQPPEEQPKEEPRTSAGRVLGKLPPHLSAALELRRQQSAVAARVAGYNWGKGLDVQTRMAISDWGQRFGVDVTTEIHILGNNVYFNVFFYLNRLATLVEAGKVEYAFSDHITRDPRLEMLLEDEDCPEDIKKKVSAELYRRQLLRIEYGAPEDAKCAVVFRVRLVNTSVEFTGCKWTGTGRKAKKDGKEQPWFADPVGEEYPVETAESRAARRALRHVVRAIPQVQSWIDLSTEDAKINLTPMIEAAHTREKAEIQAEAGAFQPRVKQLPAGDEYNLNQPSQPTPEAVPVEAQEQHDEQHDSIDMLDDRL